VSSLGPLSHSPDSLIFLTARRWTEAHRAARSPPTHRWATAMHQRAVQAALWRLSLAACRAALPRGCRPGHDDRGPSFGHLRDPFRAQPCKALSSAPSKPKATYGLAVRPRLGHLSRETIILFLDSHSPPKALIAQTASRTSTRQGALFISKRLGSPWARLR
jgi:hypothetical protein